MLPPRSYTELDESNIAHLNQVISQRWKKQRRSLIISFSLPLFFAGIPALFVAFSTVNIQKPVDILDKFLAAIWFLSLPVLLIVAFANLMLIMRKFRALYSDRKGNKKLRIPFHPYPYCIPELSRFYIKTNIPEYPYIPVDQQTYYWMNSDQVLFMDIAPKSKVLFDIKAQDEVHQLNSVPSVKTPSQNINRIR